MSGRKWNLGISAAAVLNESAYGSTVEVEVIERLLGLLDDLPESAEGMYVQATISEAKQLPKAKP